MTRTGAEIGAGLAAARPARPIQRNERIHVVGAAGAGASAAALHAQAAGALASGCDAGGPSPYSDALEAAGVALSWIHAAGHVGEGDRPLVDRLAITKALTSVDPGHPELEAARSLRIPMEPWQQVVADAAASAGQRLVAVSGTHGKSTSAGWLVHVLTGAGRDPSAFVGALLPAALTGGRPQTARLGHGETFVVEADEYAGNFDPFRPSLAILLNAEWDHPDVFADASNVVDAFADWLAAAADEQPSLTVVANMADPGAARVVERVRSRLGVSIVAVGLREQGATREARGAERLMISGSLTDGASGTDGTDGGNGTGHRLDLTGLTGWPGPVALRVGGAHNAANAVAVAGAAAVLGVSGADIADGLASFPGVGRRMELKGNAAGVTVLDDYAHHPTAIAAMIRAIREGYPGRRLWAVYEPLTYHRTAHMLPGFADALALADRAVVADIWAGRDPDTTITSAAALASAVTARSVAPAAAPGTVEETADHLAAHVRSGDVVLVMGGGRSYVICDRLLALLCGPSAAPR